MCRRGCAPVAWLHWQLRAQGSCSQPLPAQPPALGGRNSWERGFPASCLKTCPAWPPAGLDWARRGQAGPGERAQVFSARIFLEQGGSVLLPSTCSWSGCVGSLKPMQALAAGSRVFCRRGQRANCRRPLRLWVFTHRVPGDGQNSFLNDKNSPSGSPCGAARSRS